MFRAGKAANYQLQSAWREMKALKDKCQKGPGITWSYLLDWEQGFEEEIRAWKEQGQQWGHPGGAVCGPSHWKGWSQFPWFLQSRSKVQKPLVWSCSSSLCPLDASGKCFSTWADPSKIFMSRSCRKDLGHHLSEQAEGSVWILATQLYSPVLDKTICSQKTPYNVAEARCLFLITLVHAASF